MGVVDMVNVTLLQCRLTLFYFVGATWCGPCKAIAPLFQELSEAMPDVVFLKVDVDENPETAAKYSVSAMPTFLFIKGGEIVDRLMGANPDRLREMIEELM
jgi:thioredoxin 1